MTVEELLGRLKEMPLTAHVEVRGEVGLEPGDKGIMFRQTPATVEYSRGIVAIEVV